MSMHAMGYVKARITFIGSRTSDTFSIVLLHRPTLRPVVVVGV